MRRAVIPAKAGIHLCRVSGTHESKNVDPTGGFYDSCAARTRGDGFPLSRE